jgi:hypothetical protein
LLQLKRDSCRRKLQNVVMEMYRKDKKHLLSEKERLPQIEVEAVLTEAEVDSCPEVETEVEVEIEEEADLFLEEAIVAEVASQEEVIGEEAHPQEDLVEVVVDLLVADHLVEAPEEEVDVEALEEAEVDDEMRM